MATNFIQPGDTITITAPATVTSGGVVVADSIIGIALGDALIGGPVDVKTSGVFELPKVAVDDMTLGATVYYDETAELVTIDDDTGGNPKLGTVVQAAGSSTGTVRVRLSGF